MNALSAISGQFTKAFILGTLLPSVVHVMIFFALVVPIFPGQSPQMTQINSFESAAAIIPVTLAILIVSGILFNLNIPMIQLYEGYPWMSSWIGKLRVRVHREALTNLQQAEENLQALLFSTGVSNSVKDTIRDRRSEILRRLQNDFPDRADLVLPTRLGNAIRAFEQYPRIHYGIESIVMWPRLVAKIDRDYAALIADAKTSLDFMLNSSVLSTVVLVALFGAGLLFPSVRYSWQTAAVWWFELALFAVAARLFYIGAIGRAGAWGEVVKSAFDLYRLDLLKQLGYGRLPATSSEERPLWEDISRRLVFGPLDAGERRYTAASTYARGEPYTEEFQLTRGVEVVNGHLIRIVVEARNDSGQAVSAVVVTDRLADGLEYRWNSARAGGAGRPISVRVTGINPYEFRLPMKLTHGGRAVLMYEAVVRQP